MATMRLRISVVGQRTHSVAIRCPPGTRWTDLADEVSRATGVAQQPGSRWFLDAEPLADDAVLGLPPLLDGAIVGTRPTAPRGRAGPLLHLHVVGGPDSGAVVPLTPGVHRIGRSVDADVSVGDHRLSRDHVEIDVDPAGVRVRDLHTTNGSRLDDVPLGGRETPWLVGQRLAAGDSVFELRTHGSPSAATSLDGAGHILVNRRPRVPRSPDWPEVRFPDRPDLRRRARLPLLAVALPLLLAVPLAWVQRSPSYLLFGLLGPVMAVGGAVSERRGARRADRATGAEWRRATARAARELGAALLAETAERRMTEPDPAELLATVVGRLERLWERSLADPDALVLRIGRAEQPAWTRRTGWSAEGSATVTVTDVPAVVDLSAAGVLGIAGPSEATDATARSVVAQLAGWHSPRDVRLVVLCADAADAERWSWVGLLPHCHEDDESSPHATIAVLTIPQQMRHRVDELDRLVRDRVTAAAHPSGLVRSGPRVVVLLVGAHRLRPVAGLADLLAAGPAAGVHFICLAASRRELPVECGAYVIRSPDQTEHVDQPDHHRPPAGPEHTDRAGRPRAPGNAVLHRPRHAPLALWVDGVGLPWADRFARAIAPLRDATPMAADTRLPTSCRLVDLVGDDALDPHRLAVTWSATHGVSPVPIGQAEHGPHLVDLRTDGPHLLVGGTTGAGKSELLRTLICSLALAHPPSAMTFVLVDYKGGAAFDECARLPHTVGLVTDLDAHLGERALTSLRAELTRREHLLRTARVKDLDELWATSSERGLASPPRLVLVIDEFRVLAEELPAFLEGVVRVAAVGRSLGVHLVLATQRPAGVVTADIAANVNLRIALRVRDRADSDDVIEAPDAAELRPTQPGRALARSGSLPLTRFQTARVASAARRPHSHVAVELLSTDTLGARPAWLLDSVSGPTDRPDSDLHRIVSATVEAGRILRLPAAPRPWLPPLPDLVTVSQLDAGGQRWLVPYGVVDRPEEQRQVTVGWDLASDTHLGVVGTMRSGRSTVLRTLAGSLAARLTPDQVHLHAIDGGAGALLPVGRLPHAGVVAGAGEVARQVRLLDRLLAEIGSRREQLAASGWSSLAEQHRREPQRPLPYLVLLLDDWESVAGLWAGIDHGRPIESLQRLMREGPAVGLRVAVAGDRGLLTSGLASLVQDRLVLRMADPVDLSLAGIPVSAVPTQQPAGRGLRSLDRAEVQVALLDPDPSGAAQGAAVERIAARATRDPPAAPRIVIRPLPVTVALADLDRGTDRPASGRVMLGLGGDEVARCDLDLRGTASTVAGPARSGRSTTLCTLATVLAEQGRPVVAVTAGPTPLTTHTGCALVDVIGSDEPHRLARRLDVQPVSCVLVDDVERLLGSECEEVLLHWFSSSARGDGALVIAGTTADLASVFRGLPVAARRSGQGLLLQPDTSAAGDLLGVRVEPASYGDRVPGRGVLVTDGHCMPVQVALPSAGAGGSG